MFCVTNLCIPVASGHYMERGIGDRAGMGGCLVEKNNLKLDPMPSDS